MRYLDLMSQPPQGVVQRAVSTRCLVANGERFFETLQSLNQLRPRSTNQLLHHPVSMLVKNTNRRTLEMNIHSDVPHREPPCSGTLIVDDQRTVEASYIESGRGILAFYGSRPL